jgi:hypothetical protein
MRKLLSWPAVALIALLVVAIVTAAVLHRQPDAETPATPMPATAPAAAPVRQPATAAPLVGPGGFVALQSQAVKDAIHRALSTGTTQRWQDGALSGYAVPSLTTGANGCRAVRYTIDQQPGTPYGSITACNASGH